MSLSLIEYIRHILNEADYILNQTHELSRNASMKDETLKRAFANPQGKNHKQLSEMILNFLFDIL